MNVRVLWAWETFSMESAGEILPINFIDMNNDENAFSIGHEVGDGADPIQCLNGRIVRRVTLTFPYVKEEILWH